MISRLQLSKWIYSSGCNKRLESVQYYKSVQWMTKSYMNCTDQNESSYIKHKKNDGKNNHYFKTYRKEAPNDIPNTSSASSSSSSSSSSELDSARVTCWLLLNEMLQSTELLPAAGAGVPKSRSSRRPRLLKWPSLILLSVGVLATGWGWAGLSDCGVSIVELVQSLGAGSSLTSIHEL